MSQIIREQRHTISAMLKQGYKQKDIAETVGKDKYVVSREIKRNKGKRGYTFNHAQTLANERKERYRRTRKMTKLIEKYIRSKLEEDWSPEQIKGYCDAHDIKISTKRNIFQPSTPQSTRCNTLT